MVAVPILILLILWSVTPAIHAQPLAAGRRDAFLAKLEGPWQGQAVITPIGPRPYDITFRRNAQGHLEGAADPGAALHYWTFYSEDQVLKLRFLSTFAGNRQPIFLTATAEADGAWLFRDLQPDFLTVRVSADLQAVLIQVFHHDRLHVEIRLHKAAPESGPPG